MPSMSTKNTTRRNEYVSHNYKYVERLARRLARRLPSYVALEDLISAGVMGLIDAADRFDPKLGEGFEAFAAPRIKGAMLDDIRTRDTLSRDMRRLWSELRRSSEKLTQQLGRQPNDDELAARLGVSLDDLHARRLKLTGATVVNYDEVAPELLDHTPDERSEDPYSATARGETFAQLQHALSILPERLQHVISLYYGEELRLREIGEVLGVTESRACQFHTEATKRLRELMGDRDL